MTDSQRQVKEGRPWSGILTGTFLLLISLSLQAQIIDVSKPPQQFHSGSTKETDSVPSFPGGPDSIFHFVARNFKVEHGMKTRNGQEMLTIVNCIIDTNGMVRQVSLEQPADVHQPIPSEIETELLRVFNTMPFWSPGSKEGKKVDARVYIPMRFSIRKGSMQILQEGDQTSEQKPGMSKTAKISIIVVSSILFVVLLMKLL